MTRGKPARGAACCVPRPSRPMRPGEAIARPCFFLPNRLDFAAALGHGHGRQGAREDVARRWYPEGDDSMKRREFLRAAGVGLAATAVASPAIAQSSPEIKCRLTSSCPNSPG